MTLAATATSLSFHEVVQEEEEGAEVAITSVGITMKRTKKDVKRIIPSNHRTTKPQEEAGAAVATSSQIS